jgi:hypothetical protein
LFNTNSVKNIHAKRVIGCQLKQLISNDTKVNITYVNAMAVNVVMICMELVLYVRYNVI